MERYTLGLDIGITSVGACAIDQNNGKLIELSVRRFDEAKEAKEARLPRSARRTLRRKKWRKEQLLKAFDEFNIIPDSEINKYGHSEYLNFFGKKEGLTVPNVYTVYHLRQKAIVERVTKREILLCIYNILQARGHFLLDTIDFSKEGINYELFRNKFYEITSPYVEYVSDCNDFEKAILSKIYTGERINAKDLKNTIEGNRFAKDEESTNNLLDICQLLTGRKAKIGRFYNQPDDPSVNIETLKKSDEMNEFQSYIVELYDLCRIANILKDGNQYVCDIAVNEIDRFRNYKEGKESEDVYKEWQKFSKSKKHVRAYKNLNNSYPNGLYVKEVSAILHNQQKYYPEITDEFIEVCCSITSARIPYYVGPLGKHAKNAWADKKGNIKYSYDYSRNIIDEDSTIRTWKKNMVSHCTYLPEETALPKGSLLGEIFSIVNEINNFDCLDKDGNAYYLTTEDKTRIIDELFLKKDTVTLEDVRQLLDLKGYGSKKGKTVKFNNKITLYKQLAEISNELKIDSVTELFSNKKKVDRIEAVILDLNLFDEGRLKYDYFRKEFDEETARKLSIIKSNGFYSFSKKFVSEISMDTEGNTMLDLLFEDNDPSFRNNQQVIISRATDLNGNKIDFLMNKYEKIIKENGNKLNIKLVLDNGKPVIPISRPTIRALNEVFKVYQGYVDIYGIPERVVIETARGGDSIKDFTEQNGSPMKHYDKTSKLLDYLFEQLKEKDANNEILQGKIEEWDELESYYNSHKTEIELYIRQNGIDLLTGKKIDIAHLENYETDHILPRGFGDDSQDDKMLIDKTINGMKGDRLPIEFLESEDARNCGAVTVGRFTNMVNKLAEMKMISDKKQERLLLKNQQEAEGFINQNLVDTRYIISQFVSMLNAYNKVNGFDTHVVCMKASYTDLYRKVLGFNKNRNLGDQHHALDAACVAIADRCLSTYYPNYDERRGSSSKAAGYAGFETYSQFVKELNDSRDTKNRDSYSKLKRFVLFAFKKAYGWDVYKMGKEAPLLEEIKSRVPLLSWKVEKNYTGRLFDATLYKPKSDDDTSVLSILGINNKKRSFDSVYPVAVDLYKINHKHYAIHIPLAIIERDGTINKEKYIRLIKEHYKVPELLGSNGDINLKAYRFRAFKRDIVFDTQAYEPYLHNLGSIAVKKMELIPMIIYSYNSIYLFAEQIRIGLISRFNIKTKQNPDGIEFKELDKALLINYMCEEFGILDNPEKHAKSLTDLIGKCENVYDFCDKASYYSNLANSVYCPPIINGRILPVADNNIISRNPDAEYVKIKYNILGVRFSHNDKGKLIVEGPKGYGNGGFKLIKKEEFYWTIGRNMLE